MLDKMIGFLNEEDLISLNVEDVIHDAFQEGKDLHRSFVSKEYARKQALIDEKEKAAMEKELMKTQRR